MRALSADLTQMSVAYSAPYQSASTRNDALSQVYLSMPRLVRYHENIQQAMPLRLTTP